MLSAFGLEIFSQLFVMNAMKYLWRINKHKDGRERNIDKAIAFYIHVYSQVDLVH